MLGALRAFATRPRFAGWIGISIIAAATLAAVFAPIISPYDPSDGNLDSVFKGFGTEGHLLGTDELGRDVLSRLVWGARPALIQGVVPVLIATMIGFVAGIISGYLEGSIDNALMRVVDVFVAIPPVLMAIAVAATLGPGLRNLVIAMTIVLVAPVARVARGTAITVKEQDYIRAARSTGAGRPRVILRHIAPNSLGPTLAYAFPLVGIMVVFGAGMSFIGLGVQPPAADWGRMVNEGRVILATSPHVATVPGLAIFVLGLGFVLVGDFIDRIVGGGS